MKHLFCTIALTTMVSAGSAAAAPAAITNQAPVIEIASRDGFEYDLNRGRAIYRGNVVVRDPQMYMTCQILTAQFQTGTNNTAAAGQPMISNQLGGRIISITAEEGVAIINLQDKSEARGDKAYYSAETETVVLSGVRPSIRSGRNTIRADRIIFDRLQGKFRAEGNIESEFEQSSAAGGGLFNTTTKPPALRVQP